jgi:small-conductance mechanosensitive channel
MAHAAISGLESAAGLLPVPARGAVRLEEGLFDRNAPAWGWETVADLLSWFRRLPEEGLRHLREGLDSLGLSPGVAGLLVLLALLVGGLHWLVCRRRRPWVACFSERLARNLPPRGAAALAAAVSTLLGAAVPLALWAALATACATAAEHSATLWIFARLARLYAVVTLLLLAYWSLVEGEVISLRSREAKRLATGTWVLVSYVIVLRLLIIGATEFGGRPDIIAFFQFLFHLGLVLILAALLLNRRMVLAALPMVQNALFLKFLKILHRVYYLALFLTLAGAGAWLAGYETFSRFLMLRCWAVVGVFLGLIYLDRILTGGIRRLLEGPKEEEGSKGASELADSAIHLLRFGEVLAGLVLVLNLAGILDPAVYLLSTPLFTLAGQGLSIFLVLQAAGILAAVILVARLLERLLEHRLYPRYGVEAGTGKAVSTGLKYLFIVAGVLVALDSIGLDPTVLAVFAGALGIGAGLGLQRLAGNLASGLVIIFGRVVRRGDVVTVREQIGIIQDVGIRATVMKNLDNIEFIVPNENLINETIINWTYTDPLVRVHVPLGVSYGSDPEEVHAVLLEVARAHPRVRAVPAPAVWFIGFGDSSLDFELLVWMNIRKISRFQLASELYFATFRAFKEKGIEIPFPQRDLHLKSGWEGPEERDRRRGREEESRG